MGPLWLALFLQAGPHQAGMAAFNLHHYEEAAREFSEALESETAGSAAYQESALLLGESLYFQKKYSEAIPWFEKAAAGGSRALVAQYMLGNASLEARAGEQARKAFAAVFQVGPETPAAHLLTAAMMLRGGMLEDAATESRHALEGDAHIAQAHLILGEAALAAGDAAKAAGEFRKEIEINPSLALAHYRLGDAYGRLGAWEDAATALERAIWMNPNHVGPYVLLGRAYLHRGQLRDAEGALRHALQMDPQNAEARRLLDELRKEPAK
jgi:tetratricopeptide (TPR) repeat protein